MLIQGAPPELLGGLPGDSIGDFASSLVSAGKEDLIRIAAWLTFDVVLPLGPDGVQIVTDKLNGASESELEESSLFSKIADYLPGSITEKKNLLVQSLQANTQFFTDFINARGLNPENILAKVSEYADIADGKLDTVAAMIDVSTSYFEHTGTQTVARRVITRAYSELLAFGGASAFTLAGACLRLSRGFVHPAGAAFTLRGLRLPR